MATVKPIGSMFMGSRMTKGEITVAVFLPWALFLLVLLLTANVFHRAPKTVLVLLGILAAMTLPWCRSSTRLQKPTVFAIALMCVTLEVFGGLAGFITYDTVLKRYRFFEDAWFYTNVLPSDPAAGYVDAGKIVFADEAKLDFSHTIGFKDKTIYCVTPVLDDTGMSGKVQFWAAGLDCCGPRGAFVCDDAFDAQARAGLVMNDETHSHFQGSIRHKYMEAIKQAEAAYNIASADEPVLVRWVVDPNKVQDNLWSMGFGMLFVAGAFALLMSCAGAGFIQNGFVSMMF